MGFRDITDESLTFYFQNDWSGWPVLRGPSESEITFTSCHLETI